MTQLALPVYFYGQGRMLSLITSGLRRRVVAMVLGNLFFDFAGKLFQAVKKWLMMTLKNILLMFIILHAKQFQGSHSALHLIPLW